MATQKIIDFASDLAGTSASFIKAGNSDEYILRGLLSDGYISETQFREIRRNTDNLTIKENKWAVSFKNEDNDVETLHYIDDGEASKISVEHETERIANTQEKQLDENPEKEEPATEEQRGVAKISSIYGENKENFNLGQYKADTKLSTLEAENLKIQVEYLYLPINEMRTMTGGIQEAFDGMNKNTKEKVSNIGPGSFLATQFVTALQKWRQDYVGPMVTNIQSCLEDADYFDGEGTPPPGLTPPNTPKGATPPGYNGPSSPNGTLNFTSIGGGGGKKKEPKPEEDETSKIVSTVFGSLAFTSIVPLYTEIGKPATIQSSLTSQYDVTGIVYQDGKYYYRIYDSNLKTTYYAEIDKNSTFKTDYKEVLKMKEENMMLNKPEIGDGTLSKLSDPKEVYFANGTTPGTGDAEGITFANVLDGSDGKNYYVALSDSVELTPIESFVAEATGTTGTTATESVG